MHFKLDENAGPRWRRPLEADGHQASTVAAEGLRGTDDRTLATLCQQQNFCLITADIGFAQSIEYRPDEYAGLIVLRHPRPTLAGMLNLIRQIVQAIRSESPVGQLWIVEPGRIRIHGTPKQI